MRSKTSSSVVKPFISCPSAGSLRIAAASPGAGRRRMPDEMTGRRFPPPWTVEETQPCFIVRDHNGQALAFVYCEDEPGRRTTGKLLTRDEARRIPVNIAKLPSCLAPNRARTRMRSFIGDSGASVLPAADDHNFLGKDSHKSGKTDVLRCDQWRGACSLTRQTLRA
jgi:hypothetical protein